MLLIPGAVEEFRAEMNRLCPVHGFRELSIIRPVFLRSAADSSSNKSEIVEVPEVDEVLNEYERRRAESRLRAPQE